MTNWENISFVVDYFLYFVFAMYVVFSPRC